MSEQYLPTYIDNVDNSISIVDSSDSISYYKTENKINTLSAKNMANKKVDDNLNLCAFDGSNFNPVITINNNNSNCTIETNLNISGIINISKLAINGNYGSNTQYLKSGGPDSDLTWDTITSDSGSGSSLWTTSGNDIYYDSGNIGIGNTSPQNKLDVLGSEVVANFQGTGDSYIQVSSSSSTDGVEVGYIIRKYNSPKYWFIGVEDNKDLQFCLSSDASFDKRSEGKMTITTEGYVGIGQFYGSPGSTFPNSGTPYYPLDVRKSRAHHDGSGATWSMNRFYGPSDIKTYPSNPGYMFSAYFQGSLHVASDGVGVSSDSRIKMNIVDVPDNLALQQLRTIPCRYYEYIDKFTRGSAQTIGFIAQEVKTVLPMAVSQTKEIIPDIYKNINCTWTSNADNFNMSSTDLPNVNGVKYRFYVSNATDASDEQEIILTGNSDNTFTFNTQYTNVFCYGKEVDDFHTLFKDKLFTLNFSATQEIDRIQQTHITEIASLKSEVSTLKTENQEQQTKINELTSIIDKLKTANSFEEFKQTL